MKTVLEAKNAVSRMWGVPKKTEGQTYRLMNYVLRNECEDGTLLYNVVTSEMVLLDKDFELDGMLPGVYKPEMDELINHHFVVPADYNEKKSVDQLRVILRKLNRPKYITGYTIYPTTCCNARCFYCFESGFEKQTMTLETADAVVKYIAERSGGKPIAITWFGGEPLVGKQTINYICEKLHECNITFDSSMVSNAYLFDEDAVDKALNLWKLKSVQVTLDGTEEVYNSTKAYIGACGSPYKRVLDNIDLLLDAKIAVDIRLNVSHENIDNLFLLADELKERFSGKQGVKVYVHMIYDTNEYKSAYQTEDDRELLDGRMEVLLDKLIAAGLAHRRMSLPHLKVFHCMADNDYGVCILPDGKVGKCENCSANEAIGSVFGDVYHEYSGMYTTYEDYDMCKVCKLYPECLHLSVCPENGNCYAERAVREISYLSGLMNKKYEFKRAGTKTTETEDITQQCCSVEV